MQLTAVIFTLLLTTLAQPQVRTSWRKDPEFTLKKEAKYAQLIEGNNWASDWHWRVFNMTSLGLSLHLDYKKRGYKPTFRSTAELSKLQLHAAQILQNCPPLRASSSMMGVYFPVSEYRTSF